jgi:hypothetical protein
VIPDFGYLELKSFSERGTVLFKATDPQDLPSTLFLEGLEGDDHLSVLLNNISNPLKEGKVVSMPHLGIFRPLKKEDGKFHISFTPSSSFRKSLNGEPVEEKTNPLPDSPTEIGSFVEAKQELPVERTNPEPISVQSNPKPAMFDDFDDKETEKYSPLRFTKVQGAVFFASLLIVLVVIVYFVFFSKKGKEDVVSPEPLSQSSSQSINLVDLARENYGNSAFWVYIYEKNQDKLTSPVNIPKGVELVIPDLSEYNIDIKDTLEIVKANMRSEIILKKYKENKL